MHHKKFKPDDKFGPFSVLIHSIKLLDKAAEIAVDKKDLQGILDVYDRMLKASDRVMSVALNKEGEDDGESRQGDGELHSSQGFGFYP